MVKKIKKLIWQWGDAGKNPTNEDLMDTKFSEYTILFYLVREAVQNTYDAWVNYMRGKPDSFKEKNPATIKFEFDTPDTDQEYWYSGLKEARKHLDDIGEHGKRYSENLDYKNADWLKIVDTNTGGILGNVQNRTSDWWNFLLNWGRSNKRNTGSGGSKGTGRIVLPLSSKTGSVFVATKRDDTNLMGGIAMLNTATVNNTLKTATAVCAEEGDGDIWKLHDEFDDFIDNFKVKELKKKEVTGTALIIPMPHDAIQEDNQHYDKISAAFIENYAPLIVRGYLQPWSGTKRIDDANISQITDKVKQFFNDRDLQNNGVEYIEFVRESIYQFEEDTEVIEIYLNENCNLEDYDLGEVLTKQIVNKLETGSILLFRIKFEISKNGKKESSFIEASFKKPSLDQNGNQLPGIESYYRNGMSMMSQSKKLGGSMHATLFCRDEKISNLLNIFEDEGHSRWKQSEREKTKAIEAGYDKEFYLKPIRLCISSLKLLLNKFVNEVDEVEEVTLSQYFKNPKEKTVTPSVKVPKITNKTPQPFVISRINDGYRVKQHSKAKTVPKNGLEITTILASEPMLKKSQYKEQDFNHSTLSITATKCDASQFKDTLTITNIKKGFSVDVVGFDANRDLVLTPRIL